MVISLNEPLKAERVSEDLTLYGSEFHKRMVLGKNEYR